MNKKLPLSLVLLTSFVAANIQAGSLYFGPSLFIQDNQAVNSSYRGIHPRLSVGYSEVIEDIYLGTEVFAVPATVTLDDNYSSANMTARSGRSLGASIIPGFSLNNSTVGFFRLGVVSTDFSGPNTSRWGGQFGLGASIGLTPYWDLRGEYIYTTYRSAPGIGTVKTDQFGLGLIYKVI